VEFYDQEIAKYTGQGYEDYLTPLEDFQLVGWHQYVPSVYGDETSPPAHFGMYFPRAIQEITHEGGVVDQLENKLWFEVDPGYLAIVESIVDDVELIKCDLSDPPNCFPFDPQVVVGGNGTSGPTFVNNAHLREWMYTTFQSDGIDTESAAVGHVAYVNNIPYIAFRCLTDLAGADWNDNQALFWGGLASQNAALVMIPFIQALP
jgi:adenosylhomocysteine nucleosidase